LVSVIVPSLASAGDSDVSAIGVPARKRGI
jgi:hypothetical protein